MARAQRNHSGGYTFIELVVVCMLALLGLMMIMPRARSNENTLTSKGTAEELVARLRRARQTAITKGIPVALAIPRLGIRPYSDTAYQLEGEQNPDPTLVWTIGQKRHETVFYTGEWTGPEWAPAKRLATSSQNFKPETWWDGEPPSAALYIFTPSGDALSNMQAADGLYRIVVAQGVTNRGSNLTTAKVPWTVSISPSGEVGLEQGVYDAVGIIEPSSAITDPGGIYAPTVSGANNPPQSAAVKAVPDANNPNNTGKQIDLDKVLNLEVRATDIDGDPPYYQWKCKDVLDRDGNSLASDLERYGGRFSTSGQSRMEWDGETRQWVARTTWAPAPEDKGGNAYRLICEIVDRKGGKTTAGFPVEGTEWLRTIEQPWVLYRTLGPTGNWEVWKMTLKGKEHQRLVGYDYQDVIYASWSSSGDEIVFGAPDGIYRALKDGSNVRKITNNNVGPIDGVAMSPRGEAVYYSGGGSENNSLRRVALDGSGESDQQIVDFGGSTDEIYGLTTFEKDGTPFAAMGFYRHWTTLTGTEREHGLMVADLVSGAHSSNNYDDPPWGEAQSRGTTFGPVIYKIEDGTSRALWGSNSGVIKLYDVSFGGGQQMGINISNKRTFDTGVPGYVHDPRPGPDGKGLVFTSGTGAASQIYYVEDFSVEGSAQNLPVATTTRGGTGGMISRAH